VDESEWAKLGVGCLLAHNMMNRLSVILGECEMAAEKVQDEWLAKPLQRIQQAATTMAKELKEHQCRLDKMTREREARNLAEAEKASAPKLDLRCRWRG